jgi:uncharacterized protein YbbC (DUF1343 family)
MNRRPIPGVRFVTDRFTPVSGLYKGEMCEGARVVVTDRRSLQSMRMGMEIASALERLYPENFAVAKMIELVGNAATIERLANRDSPDAIVSSWTADVAAFRTLRAKYLRYQ